MKPVNRTVVLMALLVQQALSGLALANDAGRSIYESICVACHAPENVMVSSPKAGDSKEWEKRLGKGIEAVTDNALNGFGAMPPKGGASSLTREQLRRAIEYMALPRN